MNVLEVFSFRFKRYLQNNKKIMNFEVVLENIEEVSVVNQYNIKRVELCTGLDLGGLTPSYGVIESIVDNSKAEVHLMIRPRGGGFVYNDDEIKVMLKDILIAQKTNCKGVVFGILNELQEVNFERTKYLTHYAKELGLQVTFHRAIDFTKNYYKSIEILINCQVSRILTSGGSLNVDLGKEELVKVFHQFKNEIEIMPGGGISKTNASYFIKQGIKDLHFNIRKPKMNDYDSSMGIEYMVDEEKILGIMSIINKYNS
jgi:copper homeostasis protein